MESGYVAAVTSEAANSTCREGRNTVLLGDEVAISMVSKESCSLFIGSSRLAASKVKIESDGSLALIQCAPRQKSRFIPIRVLLSEQVEKALVVKLPDFQRKILARLVQSVLVFTNVRDFVAALWHFCTATMPRLAAYSG